MPLFRGFWVVAALRLDGHIPSLENWILWVLFILYTTWTPLGHTNSRNIVKSKVCFDFSVPRVPPGESLYKCQNDPYGLMYWFKHQKYILLLICCKKIQKLRRPLTVLTLKKLRGEESRRGLFKTSPCSVGQNYSAII